MYQQPIIPYNHFDYIDTDKIPDTGQKIRYSDMNFITESLFQDGSIYLNDNVFIFNPQSQTTSTMLHSGIPAPILSNGKILLPTKYVEEEYNSGDSGGGGDVSAATDNYTPLRYYLCLNSDKIICLDYSIAFVFQSDSEPM